MPAPVSLRPRQRLELALFFTVFFASLAFTSREPPWGDARPVYRVAEKLVARGSLDVGDIRWPADAPSGRHGKYYAANPLLTSLVHVPGAALNRAVIWLAPAARPWSVPLGCHLAPSALGALTCLLFFRLCRDQGMSARLASAGALMVGLGTMVWVYARSPYTEIVQVAAFTGFFGALGRALAAPAPSTARLCGIWAGILVNTKLVFAVALPGAALLLLWSLRKDLRQAGKLLLWAGVMMVPAAALILFYNWARWGGIFDSGYRDLGAVMARGNIWQGLWGMFLSPGKSVFLYCPPLLLSLVALPWCAARHRRTLLAMGVTLGPVLLVYARLPFWSGEYAWGPRYLVPLVPVLALPGMLYVRDRLPALRWKLATATAGLFAVGVAVQILGSAFSWEHFIRLSLQARTAWLGNPNRAGAVTPDRGGYCDACFEDMHAIQWLPPFQPIVGHYWALRHVPFGHDWQRAEADAPWHRQTSTRLDIARTYQRFRVDWWVLDYGQHRVIAALLLTVMLGFCGAAAYGWWRALRPE